MSVEKLSDRVNELEARLGLDAADRTYSARLLALLDALTVADNPEPQPQPQPLTDQGDAPEFGALETVLANIQWLIGGAGPARREETSGASDTLDSGASDTLEISGDEAVAAINARAEDQFEACQERVRGTNINEDTLLATDYLNHFNEIVMMLEMVPDIPELMEEAKNWSPKSYKEHFLQSSIADKELAVEVYDCVPVKFRAPFEATIGQADSLIASAIECLEKEFERGDVPLLRENAAIRLQTIHRVLDTAGAIIHGKNVTMNQTEIDAIFG